MNKDHLKRRQALPFLSNLPRPWSKQELAESKHSEGNRLPIPVNCLVPAVFLDRDGTLIEDNGALRSAAQVVFYAETVSSLQKLQTRFRLFIVTNQAGVAKGELTIKEASAVNDWIVQWLLTRGVRIADVFCCPHRREDNCVCIKPKPHFLIHAAQRYGLDLRRSFVIGDHPHDVECARNGGATGVYVLTGHGSKHQTELRGDEVVTANLAEAADWVMTVAARLGGESCDAHLCFRTQADTQPEPTRTTSGPHVGLGNTSMPVQGQSIGSLASDLNSTPL